MDSDPAKRPSYDHIIPVLKEEKYFGNDLEKTMTSLSQYHLLDELQRTLFLEKLPRLLDNFPKNVAQYNVLPSLVGMFNYIQEQKVVFPSMIKVLCFKILDTGIFSLCSKATFYETRFFLM